MERLKFTATIRAFELLLRILKVAVIQYDRERALALRAYFLYRSIQRDDCRQEKKSLRIEKVNYCACEINVTAVGNVWNWKVVIESRRRNYYHGIIYYNLHDKIL